MEKLHGRSLTVSAVVINLSKKYAIASAGSTAMVRDAHVCPLPTFS